MIAVIADDLTGAAEIAGISLLYNAKVELYFKTVPTITKANIIIICTDTRSGSVTNAKKINKQITNQLLQLKPKIIYKKIDSLLRGFVMEELQMQMQVQKLKRALILPANPSLQRIIKNGKYYINDILINKLPVAKDPEFPIKTAIVKNRFDIKDLYVRKKTEKPIENGIVIGETTAKDDFKIWKSLYNENTLYAGAADFFESIISGGKIKNTLLNMDLPLPNIYLCGTAVAERKMFIQQLGNQVVFLKEKFSENEMMQFYKTLKSKKKLLIAIDNYKATPIKIRKRMAIFAQELIIGGKAKSIFIEGGSTAAAFLEQCNMHQLEVITQLQRGVVVLKYGKLVIIVKPGSYALPEIITQLYNNN